MTVRRSLALFAIGLAYVFCTMPLSAQPLTFRRFTEPQVVSGSGISSEIVLLNTSSTTCEFGIFAHQGAGNLAEGVVIGGQAGGFALSSIGPGAGSKIPIESPNATFEGAVTVDLLTPECQNSFTVQTQYQLRDQNGRFVELFSYPTPRKVRRGQCAEAAVCIDLDSADGNSRVPGFASVAVPGWENTELCHTLKDARGLPVTQQVCNPTDGSQQAQLVTDIFGQGFESGDVSTWEVCVESPPETTPTPELDALFIDVVTDGPVLQFASNEHQIRTQGCKEDEFNACFGDRFQVSVSFQETPSAPTQRGRVSAVTPDQTGYFYFLNPDNVDLLVNVTDGCRINNHFWVFYGSATNVQYEITVTDTESGEEQRFERPPSTGLAAVTDTSAFATCP